MIVPSITIVFGYWLIPLGITTILFVGAYIKSPKDKEYGSRAPWGSAMVELLYYGGAALFSLLAWLVWAFMK